MKRLARLVAFATFVACPASVYSQPAKVPVPAAPKSLLIFYQWPSTINGANGNAMQASAEFAKYEFVILGGGLQDAMHQDHAKTKQVIAAVKRTQFFGYIPLGDRPGTDKCLTLKDIQTELQGWAAMGVKGVILDEFGFDFGVTRKRQNDCVDAAHLLKLRVIANAWNPDDVYLPDKAGVKPTLRPDDIYLWESYRFANGKPVDLADWQAKAGKIVAGRKELPLAVFSVSTNVEQPKNANERFAHQWFCAAIDGHAATGWGHPGFGGPKSIAPLMASPVQAAKPPVNLGALDGAPAVVQSTVTVKTTTGVIEVDAEKLTGGFKPKKN